MRQVYSWASALLLVVMLATSGCGGSENEPHKTGEAAGLARYEVPGETFSIGVPTSWNALSADRVFKGADIDTFAARNPDAGQMVDALKRPDSPMKFLAFDPAKKENFVTNMNIVVEPLPSAVPLDSYVEATLTQLRQASFVSGEIDHERVTLPAGPAEKISYTSRFTYADGTRDVSTLQYALVQGETAYVITYSTVPSLASAYADDFARSAESFTSSS
jgi:hypothetical protein